MKTISYIAAIFFLFLSLHLPAQTKRALVIGLGEQKDKNWAKINGDKDVRYVKDMLTRAGYDELDTLVNEEATKAGIVAAFHDLAAKCGKGDVVYIHFSGHGQQVTDVDGDEEDGWDESWIPYDAYVEYGDMDQGEKHLVDDEINVLLYAIRDKIGDEGALLVVVDACHSGGSSSSRSAAIKEGNAVRGIDKRFVIPTTEKTRTAPDSEPWLTLSACADYQSNFELKSPQVGKLTYALYSVSGKGVVTMDSIVGFMKSLRSDRRSSNVQTPVLTGDATKYELSKILQ